MPYFTEFQNLKWPEMAVPAWVLLRLRSPAEIRAAEIGALRA
jgi:hypothetical protein